MDTDMHHNHIITYIILSIGTLQYIHGCIDGIAKSSLRRPIHQYGTVIAIAASIHPPPSSSNNEYLEMHNHN